MGGPSPVSAAIDTAIEEHQLRGQRHSIIFEMQDLLKKYAENPSLIKRPGRVVAACKAHHGRADAPTACILCKKDTPRAFFMLHTGQAVPPARICVGCGTARNIVLILGTLGPRSRCRVCQHKGCSAHVHAEDSIYLVCCKDCEAVLVAKYRQVDSIHRQADN
jgi:hypothetical protein